MVHPVHYTAVHPSSVNGLVYGDSGKKGGGPSVSGGPMEGYLVYQEEIETSRVFLRETTAVPEVGLYKFHSLKAPGFNP
jgi:hypothetical protein